MRKSDLHNLTQDVDIEGFSSLGVARPTGHAVLVRSRRPEPAAASQPGSPVTPRFRRANPIAGEIQDSPADAGAGVLGTAAPAENALATAWSEPSQVRYWRTPNRLVKQVWARRGEAEELQSTVPEVMGDLAAPSEAHLQDRGVKSDGSELQPHDDAVAEPDHPAAAPEPFANISDYAFWEGLSDPVSDEIDAPFDAGEFGEAIEAPPAPAIAMAPATGVGSPLVGHLPITAPMANWSSAMATPIYSVSVRLAPLRWDGEGQGHEPAIASPASERSLIAKGGVVVTRKVREAAAPTPRRQRQTTRSIDIAPAPAPAETLAFEFELPPITFLTEPMLSLGATVPTEVLQQNAGLLEGVLEDFNVRGEIVQACPGPVVTLYELEPAPGTKSSRVISLADDIARSMSAISARVAVVQGKNAIGIELPNAKRETVFLREL
ncbi:MAG TPA: DNA translocase FtsK, partial [Bosea sp. (in: a-proteobacteria)]